MIPLAVPNLSGNEAEYLADCIRTTFVSTVGPYVSKFEQLVADAAGGSFAVATSAGTTALHAALLSIGVKPGDLVICPALTFIASANAISHCGAYPWLMDVDYHSWTLDPVQIKEEIAAATFMKDRTVIHRDTGRRVSAILPVFTLGIPANMDEILSIGQDTGLSVVVDAAAALGSTYRGKLSGGLGAQFTMYSFNGNKTVTAGGGGCIVGSDQKLVDIFRHLTTTARSSSDYDHDMVGYNYRMTNIQAAVGCAQMEQLPQFVAAKRRIAARYADAFQSVGIFRRFPQPDWGESAAWFSGFCIDRSDGAAVSASMRKALRERGVDARPFWKPMNLQVPYASVPRASLERSESLWGRIVTLPCGTGLTDAELDFVIEAVLNWSRSHLL